MNERGRESLRVRVIVAALTLGLLGGIALDRTAFAALSPATDPLSETPSAFQLVDEAWKAIDASYVDRQAVGPKRLSYGAVAGMVDALGDTGHSRFLTPEMVSVQEDALRGQFEGIGAEVQLKDGHVVIVAPIDGSPGQKAGLQSGDIILKVDGEEVTGLPLDQVVGKILGPAGTPVTLTVLDPDVGEARQVTIVRAKITLQDVAWARLPGTDIAHLRISAFSQGVTRDLEGALQEIQRQGLRGIVLDLRRNPGGLLDEAVGSASQFLEGGDVLLERDAQGEITTVPVRQGGKATQIPLVVLIDEGTASAAEVVAGALRDAGRAKLVGETTFGTGTVLNQFPLSDGSALLLATEEWLTPDGLTIWHEGLPPDVEVSLPSVTKTLLPGEEAGLSGVQLRASGDAQLLKGLELLAQDLSAP